MGLSKSSIPSTLSVSARTFVYSAQSAPVTDGGGNAYVVTDVGVVEVAQGRSTRVLRLPTGQQALAVVVLVDAGRVTGAAVLGSTSSGAVVSFFGLGSSYPVNSVTITGTSKHSTGILTTVEGELVVLGSVGNVVFAASLAEGLLWTATVDTAVEHIVMGYLGVIVAVSTNTSVYALSLPTGLVSWVTRRSATSLVVFDDSSVVAAASNGTVVQLDPLTGYVTHELLDRCTSALTVAADCAVVCFLESTGEVVSYMTGMFNNSWAVALGKGVKVSDMVLGETTTVVMYHSTPVGPEGVRVMAIADDGSQLWNATFLGTDGRLAIGKDNQLLALVYNGASSYLYTIGSLTKEAEPQVRVVDV